MRLIEDYKLEELLRYPYRYGSGQGKPRRQYDVNWKQLAQYAVSYVIEDFYRLPPNSRTIDRLKGLIENRWTNRGYKFDSSHHFAQVKSAVTANLVKILAQGERRELQPIISFEQWGTYIPALDLNLTMILQTVFPEAGSADGRAYSIQKYMVDADEEVIHAFRHMAAVFGQSAFGRAPERIDVISMLDGKQYRFCPDERSLEQSVDFLRLIRVVAAESESDGYSHVPMVM
ncbi:hypothetical protein K0T92_19315 [Paenibacillus oenotherae]|uniref:Restriction endonuclease n=1 Tax=Paenibacillus oenotherae TaxID=1435645 RepID=A0ABS7DAA5_9BACL|nr:hypothetical protein [Paenibacillus oenotherae]MBW7476870.1 hypothetical protein [Paenibacillus oenotherae]